MNFEYENVPPSRIDLDDDTYRVTTDGPETAGFITALEKSIRISGLATPPLLQKTAGDRYIIVSGFRRVRCCVSLGFKTINARTVSSDSESADLVKLSISENAFQRPLNIVEQAKCVRMLLDKYSASEIDKNFCQTASDVIGIAPNRAFIEKLLQIERLPLSVHSALIDGTVSLAMIQELVRFGNDDVALFARLFQTLKLSLGKQREVIGLTEDIALRDDMEINDILCGEVPDAIMNDENLDRNQKSSAIRKYLKFKRFPELSRAELKFNSLAGELKLDPSVRLQAPKNFEGTNFTLSLSFKNLFEFEQRKKIVDRLLEDPLFAEIAGK